jgi:hypothetical protein
MARPSRPGYATGSPSAAWRSTTVTPPPTRADEYLCPLIEHTVREVPKLRGQIEVVHMGSLPSDGKAIETVSAVPKYQDRARDPQATAPHEYQPLSARCAIGSPGISRSAFEGRATSVRS